MKVKALRYKKEHNPFQEFVHIEDMGAGEVFTSDLPKLHPVTATLKLIKEYMETNDFYEGLELDWDTVELVEFNMVEQNTVGADIRNKLSPYKNLIALVELFLKEEDHDIKQGLKKFIKKEIEQSKKSIKYISDLL